MKDFETDEMRTNRQESSQKNAKKMGITSIFNDMYIIYIYTYIYTYIYIHYYVGVVLRDAKKDVLRKKKSGAPRRYLCWSSTGRRPRMARACHWERRLFAAWHILGPQIAGKHTGTIGGRQRKK